MKKIYLLEIFTRSTLAALSMLLMLSVGFANAQNVVGPSAEQNHQPQLSVNLAVLGNASRTAADEFFEDAERYERFGDFDAAIVAFNKAAKEYKEDKKYNRYGTTLIRLSNIHVLLSNYNEAEQIVLKQVLKNYSRIGSKAGQMSAYQQLGKIYYAANKLPQSLWFYTQHGILAQQLKDNNAYIESILGIAAVKIKKKDYQLAVKDLNAAELISRNNNTVQYNQLIKSSRAIIAERTAVKKG
jgi:tetratricopeptide (TPR) repeat protein